MSFRKFWLGLVVIQGVWVIASFFMLYGDWGPNPEIRVAISLGLFAALVIVFVSQLIVEAHPPPTTAWTHLTDEERQEADTRALALLREYTTKEQFTEWRTLGRVTVKEPDRDIVIYPHRVRVRDFKPFLRVHDYCVYAYILDEELPRPDLVLALKFWIEKCPDYFFQVAVRMS